MTNYTAQEATERGTGQSVNGLGTRKLVKGAYTINPQGRKVRAFTDKEGGLVAATKWAEYCNENL